MAQIGIQRRPRSRLLPLLALPLAAAASRPLTEPRRAWARCEFGQGRVGCTVRIDAARDADTEKEATAWATYLPPGKGGWPQLEVTTRSASRPEVVPNPPATNLEVEFFAAGMLEGALTCEEIHAYWENVRGASHQMAQSGLEFMLAQDRWVREQARLYATHDEYWHAVAMVMAQHDGMLAGHNMFCPEQQLSAENFLMLNMDGDLYDLKVAFPATPWDPPYVLEKDKPHPHLQGRRERPSRGHRVHSSGGQHCSALFKLLPDHSDVYFGHDTWDTFATAGPRLFKTYTLPVLREGRVWQHINAFTSSPGYVFSMDDYYTIAGTSRLAVIETSLNVQDMSLYDLLRPETLATWLRVMVTNMLAHSAEDWTIIFARHHSGTYNCQWMVLDLGLFRQAGPVDGSFWVLEEMPGTIVKKDLSGRLRQELYWPSYNVAYFEETRRLINESESWAENARARLFESFQGSVHSVETMQRVMDWNDYLHNDISAGDPSVAIMSRKDLKGNGSDVSGGIDSKVSSFRLYEEGMITYGRVGPTHEQVPAFCWSTCHNPAVPHHGQPDCFLYDYERIWPGRSEPLLFI